MEPRPNTSPDRRRLLTLAAILGVAAVTALAFARLFSGAVAWKLLVAALTATLLGAALERRSLLLASAVSLLALMVAIGVLVFPHTTVLGLPTPETLRAAVTAAGRIGARAREQVSPTAALPPLLLAAVVAVWAAAFAGHALATRAGSPLLAVAPSMALVAFADSALDGKGDVRYAAALLLAAALVLCADGFRRLRRWGTVRSWSGPSGGAWKPVARGTGVMVGAALAVAVVLPGLLPGFDARGLVDLRSSADATHIDQFVSIQSQITREQPVELFRVRATEPANWRILTLDRFDGVDWTSSDPAALAGTPVASGESLTSQLGPDVGFDASDPPNVQSYTVSTDLDFPWIPAAYAPTSISIDQPTFRFDGGLVTAVPPEPLRAGDRYEVVSRSATPSPAELAAVRIDPRAVHGTETALPHGIGPTIAGLARSWTRGARTPYAKALAIQDRLRSSEFTYDTSVEPRADGQALLEFLTQTKHGFCQQFATAMAVLLRELGYPARVAIGFTQGQQNADGTYVVTTSDAHAWPEAFFPGYGWLAFEPTPGRDDAAADTYLNASLSCANTGVGCATPAGGVSHANGSQIAPSARNPRGRLRKQRNPDAASGLPVSTPRRRTVPWKRLLAFVLLAGLLLGALMPIVRWLKRRARVARAREPRALVLALYDVFAARAGELGLARAPGETMDQYRVRVRTAVRLRGDGLDRLTAIATRAAYAPAPIEPGEAREADEAAQTAIRELRRDRGRLRRLAGLYRVPERW
jgi:transglutaminase-like putative cysteine protease